MKKLMMAAAALCAVATAMPAHAQPAYGNDAVAWIDLDAEAVTFCKLTRTVVASGGAAPVNATVSDGTTRGGGAGFVFSDAIVNLQLQNPSDNTVRNAYVGLVWPQSQCNTRFVVSAESDNKGLKYFGPNTDAVDDDFILPNERINYRVRTTMDGIWGLGGPGAYVDATSFTANSAPQPARAGDFIVDIDVPANSEYMLKGEYYDFLRLSMVPQV